MKIKDSILPLCFPVLILTVLIIFSAPCVNAQGQTPLQGKPTELSDSEIINRVLDLLFPRDVLEGDNIKFAFVLRFRPSFAPETQITIVERTSGLEVIEYMSLDGNLDQKITDILIGTGQTDAKEIAQKLRIKKRVLKVSPAQVRRWRSIFYDRLSAWEKLEKKEPANKKGPFYILLDGTIYNLWYRSRTGAIFYDLSGSEINGSPSNADSPLIQWMNNVRREIKKL